MKKLEQLQKQKGVTKKIKKEPQPPKQAPVQQTQKPIPDYDDDEEE